VILASAFLNQLNSGNLEIKPIYLLYGEEPLFLRDSSDGLKKQLVSQGYMVSETYDVVANFVWQNLQIDTQLG